MEVLVERCAGIDVGMKDVKVCVRRPGGKRNGYSWQVRTFATTTRGLLAMADWLRSEQVTRVGMESTGVYWKPVFYILEGQVECWLVNPQHIKKVPGRKTDVSDAQWIADLVAHGLVRPSLVPSAPVRALRDLTRYRSTLVRERSQEVQRLHAVLEDAGIKLDCVVSDIVGVSGRAMLEALVAGQRDPEQLAALAQGRMRVKIPALVEALTGHFTDHHALMVRMMLDRLDELAAHVERLSAQVELQMEPFRERIARLCTVPGISRRVAEVIIAEIGGDIRRFPSAAALVSWAAVCPGNNESAGRHFAGTTRHGNAALRAALGEAAIAASRTRGTYLAARYWRLARRRGKKRALLATARMILEAVWHMLTDDVDFIDLGPDYLTERLRKRDAAQRARRAVHELEALGFDVELTPTAA